MSAVAQVAARASARASARAQAPSRIRGRVQTQWLALGAALVVLSGVLVAWGLSQATERVQVVQLAREVKAGHVLEASDLTVAGVAYDGAVHGLVPARSLPALVGRVAAVDLTAGSLMQVGMWSDLAALSEGEQRVGAVLPPGRYPAGVARGDVAVAASIDASATLVPVTVRVLDAEVGANGEASLTLAVDEVNAVAVAQLAATDQLLLVVRPAQERS